MNIPKKEISELSKHRSEHIGQIWSDIFSALSISPKGPIIEIAPGGINKIGHGLRDISFAGDVYIIEPNKKALDTIISQYKENLPQANIIPLQATIQDAIPHLPNQISAIVSNHPLDDMIIGKSMDKKHFDDFFDDHYEIPFVERTRDIREILDKKTEDMQKAKRETLEDILALLSHTNPEYVIISQYESHFFKENNIIGPDKHAYDVLTALKNAYKDFLIHPYPSTIDHSRWMALHLR